MSTDEAVRSEIERICTMRPSLKISENKRRIICQLLTCMPREAVQIVGLDGLMCGQMRLG